MAGPFAELKIGLDRRWGDVYTVDLELTDPESATVDSLAREVIARFDFAALQKLRESHDFGTYGKELTASLLGDKDAYTIFDRARQLKSQLRIVLSIRPSALELHDLCWESICDPKTGARLLETPRVLFSRFLSSDDGRQVRLRSLRDATALVVGVNPTGDRRYPLAPIPKDEVERAVANLAGVQPTVLDGHATLNAIIDRLEAQPADVLYLICHGSHGESDAVLYLESEDGGVEPVHAKVFADRIAGLVDPPSIVVIAACESAAPGKRKRDSVAQPGATAAVGPMLLANAPVAAVVAMQGEVTQQTAGSFIGTFFKGLCDHGHVDLAANEGRDAIRERDDWWIPTLFSRLHTGQIWYTPGFHEETDEDKLWRSLGANFEEKAVTPILGAELLKGYIGSTSDIALGVLTSYLAQRKDIPWSMSSRSGVGEQLPIGSEISSDLVQVTQFLRVLEEEAVVRTTLRQAIKAQVRARFPEVAEAAPTDGELVDLLSDAGAVVRERGGFDPFVTLAKLPIRYYVTTTPDRLLEDALRAAKRKPVAKIFRWGDGEEERHGDSDGASLAYKDRIDAPPLVWYMLGRLDHPESLVLTEDHYLAFHVAIANARPQTRAGTDDSVNVSETNRNVVPPALLRALGADALMFVGFRLDDWAFRVLFRSVAALQQHDARKRPLIAVQLAPDERKIRNPQLAREYLQGYFSKAGFGPDIHVYWGTAAEFLRDLAEHVTKDSGLR